jgi:galactoside O-acetyltransferase
LRLAGIVSLLGPLVRELHEAAARRRSLEAILSSCEGLSIGRSVEIRSAHRLRLGRRVMIDTGTVLHCGGMEWSAGEGGIEIGDDSYVGPHCVFFGAGGIRIGSRVLISPSVVIVSHQHTFGAGDQAIAKRPTRFAQVLIEDDVWIGSNAVILPGVRLERGAVVGAGAVVTRSLPPRSLWTGVPAALRRRW